MEKILITGISSGIGKYISEKLLDKNKITGVGRTNNNIIGIDYIKGDLKNIEFLRQISEKNTIYDFIILNAGIGYFDNFENIGVEKHKEIIETNLLSPIIFSNLLLKEKKIKSGIIFIGSIAGKKSMKLGASYAASKFGLRGFAMQLKNEYTKLKIHLINPSIVDTNFHKNTNLDFSGFKKTPLEDILMVVENIINGKEKRFEIDL